MTNEPQPPPEIGDPGVWIVLAPDGALHWHTGDDHALDALVGGERLGAAVATTAHLGPAGVHPDGTGAMRIKTSDVGLIYPDDYPPNPVAQHVITALSNGYVSQRWAGHLALSEYSREPDTGEVWFPKIMSDHWLQRVLDAHAEAVKALGVEPGKTATAGD